MKLMTKEIEQKFKKYPLYSQEGKALNEAVVVVKFFNPCGVGTWLITEGEKKEDGDWLFFGYLHAFAGKWEWGYVMLSELQNLRLPYGLGVERDLHIGKNPTVYDLLR